MNADDHTIYIVWIAGQRLAQEINETTAVQKAAHADDPIAGESTALYRQISQGVRRIRDNDKNSFR